MKRHCLFIDDDIEEFESVIQLLPSIAKKSQGIDVTYELLDPSEKKYRDNKNNIDLNKLEEDFVERIKKSRYDLIACDYNLSDEMCFGTDIIKSYRQRDRKFIAIIYSANLKEIVRQIIKSYDPLNMDVTLNKINGLVTSQIYRFFSKTNQLMNDLAPILYETPIEKHIEQVLIKYQDLELTHGFASLIGVPFAEIAGLVRSDSDQGKKFVEEVIERGITHLIELNE